ncbi:MAG TPA: FHA domain-containing protein, partial [Ktedonobacterales bacterium]
MICPNCGQVTLDSAVCSHCGASLETSQPENAGRSDGAGESDYFPYSMGSGTMHIFGMDNLVDSPSDQHNPATPVTAPTLTTSSAAPAALGHLVVHPDADNWGSATEQTVSLEGQEVTIGRSPGCTISLAHDVLVSRHHAVISYRGTATGYMLTDLGSSNGTTVNGMPVAGEHLMRAGDVIRIGDCEIIYSTMPLPTAAESAAQAGEVAESSGETRSEEITRTPTMPPQTAGEGASPAFPGTLDPWTPAPEAPLEAPPLLSSWQASASSASGASGTSSYAPSVPDLDVLQTQLTDMVSQLRRQADTSVHQVAHLKTEIATVVGALATLVDADRQQAQQGPDLSPLIQVTGRVAENPRHLDNVIEFASHAADIGAALQALEAIRSSSGLVAAVDALRARLAA